MRYLLDTNALLVGGLAFESLPASYCKLLTDPATELYLSPASLWEMAIKVRPGKLNLQSATLGSLAVEFRKRLKIRLLPTHCAAVLHVQDIGLDESPDTSIWCYARQHGYDLLAQDEDFVRLLLAKGFLPRVVALQNAPAPVKVPAAYLLVRLPQRQAFLSEQQEFGMLQVRLPG